MNKTPGHFLLPWQASRSPSIILRKAFIFVVRTLSPCDHLPEIYFLGVPTGLARRSEDRASHGHEDAPHLCAGSRASGVAGCCNMYFAYLQVQLSDFVVVLVDGLLGTYCLGHEDSHNTLWIWKIITFDCLKIPWYLRRLYRVFWMVSSG